jgi:hypothetical protein
MACWRVGKGFLPTSQLPTDQLESYFLSENVGTGFLILQAATNPRKGAMLDLNCAWCVMKAKFNQIV